MTSWYLWQYEWTWGYYAKPNNSDRKREIPYDVTCEIWKHTYINKPKQINRTEYWLPKDKGQGRKNWWKWPTVRRQTETTLLVCVWCSRYKSQNTMCTHETFYAKDQCYFSWKEERKRTQLALSREFEHELALSLGLNMYKETVTWGNLA